MSQSPPKFPLKYDIDISNGRKGKLTIYTYQLGSLPPSIGASFKIGGKDAYMFSFVPLSRSQVEFSFSLSSSENDDGDKQFPAGRYYVSTSRTLLSLSAYDINSLMTTLDDEGKIGTVTCVDQDGNYIWGDPKKKDSPPVWTAKSSDGK